MSIEKKAENLDKALSYKFMVTWQLAVAAISVASTVISVKYLMHAPMILLLCCVVLLFALYVITLNAAVRRSPELGLKFAAPVATNVCMPPAIFTLLGLIYTLADMKVHGNIILAVAMVGSMLIMYVCARSIAKIEKFDKNLSTYKEIEEILYKSEVSEETRKELLSAALR